MLLSLPGLLTFYKEHEGAEWTPQESPGERVLPPPPAPALLPGSQDTELTTSPPGHHCSSVNFGRFG